MTRRGFAFLSLLLAALAAPAQLNSAGTPAAAPPPNADSVVVIRAGRLIDGTSNQTRVNQVIVVRGNHIASVGAAASANVPAGAQVIDLSNATVLPGMIE